MGRTERVGWIDGLKALAIGLVVVGHVVYKIYGENVIFKFIYLFHMPLFFMISGITYELFSKNSASSAWKVLLKREMDLIIPAVVFTMFNYVVQNCHSMLDYCNNIWFIVFLSLIILWTIVGEQFFFRFKLYNFSIFIAVALWILFGIIQLALLSMSKDILAKFACETAKFFGYYICFSAGRFLIRNEAKMKFGAKFAGLIMSFALTLCLAFLLHLESNVALPKIVCGLFGGVY